MLYETIGYILKNLSTSNSRAVKKYEETLTPHLNKVVSENRTDMIGYVFQIYAAMILYTPDRELSNDYSVILGSVTDADNWKKDLKYLAPGQAKIIAAVAYRHPNVLKEGLGRVFEIYDTLLNEFNMEEHALDYLSSLMEAFSIDDIASHLSDAVGKAFNRMQLFKQKSRAKVIPKAFKINMMIFFS